MDTFHDYLGLASARLADVRLVAFCGESGSGKSTAIDWLRRCHPDVVGCMDWTVVEEIADARDWPEVPRMLAAGRRLLVASHLGPIWYRPLRVFGAQRLHALDARPEKIAHWLAQRGVAASADAVRAFVSRFGANYTDAALVLERAPGLNFDRALARFLRECRLERIAERGPRGVTPP